MPKCRVLVWWRKKKETRHSNLKQPARITKTVAAFAPSRPRSYCYSKNVRDITKYQLNVVGQIILTRVSENALTNFSYQKYSISMTISLTYRSHLSKPDANMHFSLYPHKPQHTCMHNFSNPRAICHVMSMVWDRHHNYEYEEIFAKMQKILPIKIMYP